MDKRSAATGRRSKKHKPSWWTRLLSVLVVVAGLLLSACSTPVGVQNMSSRESYRNLTADVLSAGTLSSTTTQILNRAGLAQRFESQPDEVIATIHKGLPNVKEPDRLFALAELSFLHAMQSDQKSHFLSAVLYAYGFLFPTDVKFALDPFDPRTRTAVDIYNQGLAEAFSTPRVYPLVKPSEVVLIPGTYSLPFGKLTLRVNSEEFVWGTFLFTDFVQASQVEVRGLRNRYRWPGLGAALVASLTELPGARDKRFARVPPGLKVPVTAVLRVDKIHEALKTDNMEADLQLFTVSEQTTLVTPQGQIIPLEFELTAALASSLEGSAVYDMETKGFFLGDFRLLFAHRFEDGVFLMAPYRSGRIPVVLVHGTASSPARWAELINEIQNDRDLWGRYQLWLFTYNTGNPILYSAGMLTEGLRNIVHELDPNGTDAALRKMVVIGHSQGGLLTKLTVVNSGSVFWDNAFEVPIGELDVSPETRRILRRSMFYTPLPFVRRVVFVATPHGGSFVAGGIIGKTAGSFIKLPFTILSPIQEVLLSAVGQGDIKFSVKNIPKSTDNMNPQSPFIKALSSLSVAPTVTAYSIIPVKNLDAPKNKWHDGVVEYLSAHIEGVRSELIVDSDHSTQGEPATIEEIRRILLENLQEP